MPLQASHMSYTCRRDRCAPACPHNQPTLYMNCHGYHSLKVQVNMSILTNFAGRFHDIEVFQTSPFNQLLASWTGKDGSSGPVECQGAMPGHIHV